MSETNLTQEQIIRAATNDPALSATEFQLGDRTFKVVDLPYDDYLTFLAFLQPLLEAALGSMTGATQVDAGQLLNHCGKTLPEMVHVICRQTDPDITVEEVKALGKTPFKMAGVVLLQIEQNRMIQDLSDFFVQILPMLQQVSR